MYGASVPLTGPSVPQGPYGGIRSPYGDIGPLTGDSEEDKRATTNIQHQCVQLFLFYLFFSFVLIELKPFVLKGKVLGENSEKSAKKVPKIYEK